MEIGVGGNRTTRYTVYINWDNPGWRGLEEIDVDAESELEARQKVEAILRKDHESGWEIDWIEERQVSDG